MSNNKAWQPILEGEDRRAALDAVDGICRDLATLERPNDLWGPALFFSYCALAPERESEEDLEQAGRFFTHALAQLPRLAGRPRLFGAGFPTVGWLVAHLSGRTIDLDADTVFSQVDAEVLEAVRLRPTSLHYDLMGGLVGLGVYALERLPSESGARILAEAVDRLAETSEPMPSGIAWRTSEALLMENERAASNGQPVHNLGMAHGIAGIVAFLGRVCASHVAGELPGSVVTKARRLLDGGVSWLWSLEPVNQAARFALLRPGRDTRLAWCYGDPGVAAALWLAGRPDEAMATVRLAASHPFEGSMVADAGLCHGAVGIGHVFNRLFQATGDQALGEAARTWFGRALRYRDPGQGYGGFRFLRGTVEKPYWGEDANFLSGSSGVGLALLAATSVIEPQWDRLLLLS